MKSSSHSKSHRRSRERSKRGRHRRSGSSSERSSSRHGSSRSGRRREKPSRKDPSRRRNRTRSRSSSDDRSSKATNKHADLDAKMTPADLKEKMRKALDRAENQDVKLKEVKEIKARQIAAKDIQLASNPDDPLARANIIEAIKSDSFSQATFVSGNHKLHHSSNLTDEDRHEDAIFGPGPKGAGKGSAHNTTSKFDLSSIQLPSERPKNATSAITDPRMLVNKRFHVTKEEKARTWMTYYDVVYGKFVATS